MPTRSKVLKAIPLLLSLAACGPSAEKREAERILHAIDNLRDAPSEAIEPRLELVKKLEQEPVNTEAAKRARDTCAKAYAHLLEGQRLKLRVSEALKDPQKLNADTVRDLGRAETQIQRSVELMPECSDSTFALRRPKPP